LERGKGNLQLLNPLYEYAYKVYGTTFSLREESLKETPDKNLEGKIAKELEAEKDDLKQKKLDVDVDTLSNEERMLYFLQKAKDKQLEKKKSAPKMLIMD